ncbi:MAG: rhomboid family intramembrane serine protease [Pseudomonadales bacterium]
MRVIETSVDEDLSLFSSYLWQRRVPHRIFQESGAQVVELADPGQEQEVRDAYRAWKSGRLTLEAAARPRAPARWPRALVRYRGLTLLIALTCLAFPFSLPLSSGTLSDVAAALTIVDPRSIDTLPSLPALLAEGQVWRWFTPIFLHFSVLHLAFNCAITIELGRRVEGALGALGLWLLVLALAAASNLCQFAFGGGPLFGGLSGVAYGLLGFVLVMARRWPAAAVWRLPPGLSGGLLVFLVLFSTGVTEAFGLYVANAAHWSGLAAGALLGALWRAPAEA